MAKPNEIDELGELDAADSLAGSGDGVGKALPTLSNFVTLRSVLGFVSTISASKVGIDDENFERLIAAGS